MAIQVLKQEEINEVSGGVISISGLGLNLSLDPAALLGGVFGLVGALVASVTGLVGSLVGVVTGLVGTGTGLLGGLLGGLFS
ncbi:MAG: hypothetical protein PHR30_15825 [Gallionellaceae bacterium]|nr:hypothetical protein [Gallionellaceae bacterium]